MERWKKTKVLIIDEISMIDAELFDKLNYIAKRSKVEGKEEKNEMNEPFGEIQLIATGDFFQLPPVSKNSKFDCFYNSQKEE